MGWIAVAGGDGVWRCPERLAPDAPSDRLLPRGTFMLEFPRPEGTRETRLAGFERRAPWPARLALSLVPGEGVVLEQGQGVQSLRVALPLPDLREDEGLRISLAWDGPAQRGRLAAERLDGSVLALDEIAGPVPLSLGDVLALCAPDGPGLRAVADTVEPLGPVPTLDGETPVETAEGPVRVADLRCGDTVRTRDGTLVPVLARVERRVPALGSFAPVLLRAPWFGLRQDVRVSAGQALLIGGSDVAYFFGCDEALLPVRALPDGPAAEPVPDASLVTWHQLILPGNEPLLCAGAWLDSLWIGRLRRQRAVLRHSLLAGVPASLLPEHGGRNLKLLKSWEAATLVRARAA